MNHGHHHETVNSNRPFAIGVILNVVFVVIEAGYGIAANSLALIADAGHNLSDVASLLLAWGASVLATKSAQARRTYGFRKVTVMASLASGILLLVVLGGITWEAVGRFLQPRPVAGMTVIVVAAIGVVINALTAMLFLKGQKEDLNIRGAFLHMTADAAVSLGVVVAGILIAVKGWLWIDPVISLAIVAVIFTGTWGLVRESLNYAIDAVPRGIDMDGIKEYLSGLEPVERIHDLHVWPLSTTETALTVHLVTNHGSVNNNFLAQIQRDLHDHFAIEHATIQIESATGDSDCRLDGHSCE